jgi:4-alpha-glucanotransferase
LRGILASRSERTLTPSPSPKGRGEQSGTQAYIKYLAQTPSPLILIPLEDALARKEQPNLPGTVDSRPNWQHRLPEDAIDRLQPLLRSISTSLKEVPPA